LPQHLQLLLPPWPHPEQYETWPANWFYDARYCVNGEPRRLLPDCPSTDPMLGYRALQTHWRAMREMAEEAASRVGWPTTCAHGSARVDPYDCGACFDAELRKVVGLRFAPDDSLLDAIDGERSAFRGQRLVEEATYRVWAAERTRKQQAAEEEQRWLKAEDRREEDERRKVERQRGLERDRLELEARNRRDAAFVEQLLEQAQRPRLTEQNAHEWPPPYPYARRCKGAECACKQYGFLGDVYPSHAQKVRRGLASERKRFKKKDPFKCRGNFDDPWVCESPCVPGGFNSGDHNLTTQPCHDLRGGARPSYAQGAMASAYTSP